MKLPIFPESNGAGKKFEALFLSFLFLTSFAIMAGAIVKTSAEESTDGDASMGSQLDSDLVAASGSNRFVVWEDNTPGNYDILLKRSTDNGATWKAAKNLSENPGDSTNPEIAILGSNVYVVWLQTDSGGTKEDIFFRRSVDNGATWKSIFNVSNNQELSKGEAIAVSGSNVYIAWSQSNSDNTQTDVFFRRSTDNGATWKTRVIISNTANVVSLPSMSISGSYIHIVWNQADPALGASWPQVYIRSSANGGAAWNAPKDLTSAKETFLPAIVTSSGTHVYVAYERVAFDSAPDLFTDILLLSSNNNGQAWNPPITIAEFEAANGENGPWLGATGSNVFLFWVYADFQFGDLFFRKSTNFGASWGPVSADLNNKDRTPLEVQLVVSGSNVYLVWSNIWPFEVYFLRSTSGGTDWNTVKNISSNSGRSSSPVFGG